MARQGDLDCARKNGGLIQGRRAVLLLALLLMAWSAQESAGATWADTPLLHNSLRFACSLPPYSTEADCTANGGTWNFSRKWPGGWGVPGQRYGGIDCATCHVRNPGNGNIKRLRPAIAASADSFPGSAVVATRAVPGTSSDFGDDGGGHETSSRICEACHSLTTYHRFDTTQQVAEGGSLDHFNSSDCASCHLHKRGFRAGCSDCHGNSLTGEGRPDSTANNINTAYSWADDVGSHVRHVAYLGTGNASCASCHPLPTPAGSSHINLNVEVTGSGFGYAEETGTCSAVTCHGNTDAQWGASGCFNCHSVIQGARAAIAGQFAANSHHIQGVAVTNAHCYQCHWESNIDGTINAAYHGRNSSSAVDLVVYGAGTRPLTYLADSTAIQYMANGTREEIAKLNPHCLGCHRDANNLAFPFGDGKTPKQYAWDGTSIGSRYSQTGTTPWGKYSGANVTPKAARSKAYSAHGNAVANQGGWDLSESWPNTRAGTTNIACFDCHNAHGSPATGRTTSYASATASGGLLKTTVSGAGGYTVNYTPQAGGTAANKNLRNSGGSLCLDCHLVPAGGTSQPWGYQATFGSAQEIVGYYDGPWSGSGAAGTLQRYPYKALRTTAGGHFGASSPLKSPAMGAIDGLCTPCHDPHGVSPSLGSNQPYAVPLLKGTWITSPYMEDVAPSSNGAQTIRSEGVFYRIDQNTFGGNIHEAVSGIAENDAQFGGLCLQCHPKERLTNGATHTWKSKDRVHESVKGWKTAGTPAKHQYTCSKCHSPHLGSALPRLMVTNCLDGSHKGRVGSASPPVTSSGGDSGSGRIPGSYSYTDEYESVNATIACHEGPNGYLNGGTDQNWNLVTPWYVEEPLVITGGASAAPSGTIPMATITWATSLPASSWVDYGLSTAYGSTTGNSYWYSSHTVQLLNLTNHRTYHYRVRSTSYKGQQVVSADQTFFISIPPTVPVAIVEPDKGCPSTCSVTLAWNASTDLDNGPIQYEVEVDDDAAFATLNASSGWVSGTTATVGPLDTEKIWYWRVRARDANHVEAISAWSGPQTFRTTSTYSPPGVPTFNSAPTSVSCAEGCSLNLTWSASTSDPDNGPVEYFVEVDNDAAFGSPDVFPASWLSTTSFLASPLTTETTWDCRVQARYAEHPEAVSAWSATKAVPIFYPPPTAPTLSAAPPSTVCAGNCSVPLAWNAATAYNNGAVEYYVEVDDDSAFAAPVVMNSGWATATTWDATPLDTAKTWYWRVRSRDAAHPTAMSAWSSIGSFKTMTAEPPPAPVVIPHADYDSGCADTVVTVEWNSVTSSDGDLVEYYVSTDIYGDGSGWLPAGTTSWSFTLPRGWGVTWQVMARDAGHPDATSAWSSDYFYDVGSQCWWGSCPLVFGWDGTSYGYVTDLQGPIIGLPSTNIQKDIALYQPTVAVLDRLVLDDDGNYGIKLRESLPEITFIDSTRLLVVDYPEGYQFHTSGAENTYNYGYADPLRIYTAKDPLLPISATDSQGRDVLTSVLTVDNLPAPMEVNDPGNYYTVNFGNVLRPQFAKLLIDGWSVYGVKKFKSDLTIQPFIEVVDQGGNWVKAKTFGTPAGDLKTMVVDLSNLFLSDDHRVRIHLGIRRGSRWVIDRIRLDQSEPVSINIQELQATAADLQFGGIAIQSMSTLDSRIIASDVSLPVNSVMPSYGDFTRYGNVAPLLAGSDDKFVIMREGDKIDLRFPAPLGEPQQGFSRGFILISDLYYKTLTTSTVVEPLPFHGMSDYPYPGTESYPTDADHLQYLQEYNTRIYSSP